MKPSILEEKMTSSSNVTKGHVPSFSSANNLQDSGIAASDLLTLIGHMAAIIQHYQATDIHITEEERNQWNQKESIIKHTSNEDVHVTLTDKTNWNNKETAEGARAKANEVMSALNSHMSDVDRPHHMSDSEKAKLDNVYTKEEIDNLFSMFETNIDWKESVDSYEDLLDVYKDPYDGWTVNVLDNDLTYRYSESEKKWICISANVIPLATRSVDGLLTASDKSKLDGIEARANRYVHPNSSSIRHVTDDQINLWNRKASTDLVTTTSPGLMSAEDKAKLDGIESNANKFVLNIIQPNLIQQNSSYRFVSDTQIALWTSKASTVLATEEVNGLMSKDDKIKLGSIESGANNYTHPEKHPASIIEESTTKKFVSNEQIVQWNAKYGKDDIVMGSTKFSGTSGVTIIHDFKTLSYTVSITPTSHSNTDPIGDIWVVKSTMSCIVYCSGNNRTASFDYMVVKGIG